MSHESDESAPCESVVLFSCALDRIGVSKNGEPVEFHWLFNHTVTYSCVHTRLSFSICCYSKTQFKWLHWWQDYSPLGSGMLAEFSGAQYWYIFSLAWDLTFSMESILLQSFSSINKSENEWLCVALPVCLLSC